MDKKEREKFLALQALTLKIKSLIDDHLKNYYSESSDEAD